MDYASSLLGLLPGGRRTPGLKELLGTVDGYLPPDQVGRIREAAEFGTSTQLMLLLSPPFWSIQAEPTSEIWSPSDGDAIVLPLSPLADVIGDVFATTKPTVGAAAL